MEELWRYQVRDEPLARTVRCGGALKLGGFLSRTTTVTVKGFFIWTLGIKCWSTVMVE